jgi:hypothetical protein
MREMPLAMERFRRAPRAEPEVQQQIARGPVARRAYFERSGLTNHCVHNPTDLKQRASLVSVSWQQAESF